MRVTFCGGDDLCDMFAYTLYILSQHRNHTLAMSNMSGLAGRSKELSSAHFGQTNHVRVGQAAPAMDFLSRCATQTGAVN